MIVEETVEMPVAQFDELDEQLIGQVENLPALGPAGSLPHSRAMRSAMGDNNRTDREVCGQVPARASVDHRG